MAKIGDPQMEVEEWLDAFASTCEVTLSQSIWPWRRIYLKARIEALHEAANLVRRSKGLEEVGLHGNW